jgi:uncharacterized membrane protein
MLATISITILNYLIPFFMLLLCLGIVAIIVMYIIDITQNIQNTQTIRKNYPVIGRFRYFFEHLGEFFRQ